ncbi:MAG: hypothetical protein JO355_12880 [Planctomycetaceae bacterium]|jgi:hypothetical protein|nr:hypothetical protein [Planctomycetaceae bacterium]MBV8266761.1 hypothetical protein [Planctomycetaceae bacterium]MBV8678049.1 hypothetical protein [Planctomycetaceae bacterium]
MAAIVLVHGIDSEQLTPDGIEAECGREDVLNINNCYTNEPERGGASWTR